MEKNWSQSKAFSRWGDPVSIRKGINDKCVGGGAPCFSQRAGIWFTENVLVFERVSVSEIKNTKWVVRAKMWQRNDVTAREDTGILDEWW